MHQACYGKSPGNGAFSTNPAEVDEAHARVVADGFDSETEPFDAFWGQPYASLRDPDGVHVDLYAAL